MISFLRNKQVKRKLFALSCLCFVAVLIIPAFALDSWPIKRLKVLGVKTMPSTTVLHYLALQPPFTITPTKATFLLKKLYHSGLFADINLSYLPNTLVVQVSERPIIVSCKISGNTAIATDKLTTILNEAGLAEGQRYDAAILTGVINGLNTYYRSLGYYSASVNSQIKQISSERVALTLIVHEGQIAKINKIQIIGNHQFSERTLIKQLPISTSGLFTFLTQTDRYTPDKLTASSDSLSNFYLNHGYLQVNISHVTAKMNEAKTSVAVSFTLSEGKQYYLAYYKLRGQHIIANKVLEGLIKLPAGMLCARQAIVASEQAITDEFGKQGYLYVTVAVIPHFIANTNKVWLEFVIKPGHQVYVNHIAFVGNHRTNDQALRRESQQFESSIADLSLLNTAKHHLSLLPFMKDVQMNIAPVTDHDDLVNVIYTITEDSSAQASITASYSMTDGFGLGLGLNQKNFFGTGNALGVNFNENRYEKYYNISYSEPYYTIGGVSRDVNIYVSRVNPAGANLTNSYTSNDFGGSVVYGVPLNKAITVIQRAYVGLGYENILLHLTNNPSKQIIAFVAQHGRHFAQLNLRAGITSDSRDKAIFPNSGIVQKTFVDWFLPLASSSLNYYQLSYDGKTYYPIVNGFIATAHAALTYGNGVSGIDAYPLFKNYYAGGFESVHGYLGNSLGPQDSNANPLGGNILAIANLGLILPNFIADSLRTTIFVDAGNVFYSNNNKKFGGNSSSSGPLRYSSGIEVDWLAPMGFAIGCSYAQPLVHHSNDKEQRFQFSLGANLG